MVCPDCGVDVAANQKFCHECGTALADREQPDTEPDDVIAVDEPPDTEPVEAISVDGQPDTEPVEVIPQDGQPDTEPVEVIPQDGQPDTEPVEVIPVGEQPDTEPVDVVPAEPIAEPVDALAPPAPIDAFDPPAMGTATEPIEIESPDADTTEPTDTLEMPALFDGSVDLVEYPVPREPFRLRIIFLLSLFGAVAVLMSMVANVIDIRTTRPTAGIATGAQALEDIGSNLGLAAFSGAAVMVLGSLLACFGLRWGAGLAGGAGAALVGWAGLTIGLAEFPIAIAESITRAPTTEQFTLRVTRDIGWWLIAGVGVIGVVVFFASLRSIGTGSRRALNPLIAAVTAVATVVLGFGPLVPVGNASYADNFRSTDPSRDLPAAFFAGRLGQVALIAAIGAFAMLIVRAYGLGLAAGSVSVAAVMWATSLAELGDRPIGIADRNPGATNTVPHAVTTVGMVSTLALLAIAAVFAIFRLNRRKL